MDPLTLAATIAGVAGHVATVVSATYSYGSSVIHANKAVKNFVTELQDLRTISFLKQLAQQYNQLLPELEELHQATRKQNRGPKQGELISIILSLLSKFTFTFIIVDALDECSDTHRNGVLAFVSQLRQAGANVFTTSRPHIEPPNEENDVEWEYIEIKAHDEDIRRVFEHALQQKDSIRKKLSPDFKDEIIHAIVEKAAGMFLWASLQIAQILNHRTPTLIRRALQSMPTKIFDVFSNTLERIGDDDLARRALLWLAMADEPLSFPALSHALAIDPECPTPDGVDEDSIPEIEDLVEICCGLVAVDGDQNLRFVHFTVQEYFSKHPESLLPLSGLVIAKCCLSYLTLKDFESGYCDSEEKIVRRLEQYPLYSFAARRWNIYVSETDGHQVENAVLSIYLHEGLFGSYAQVRYSDWASYHAYGMLKYFEFQRGYSPLHDAIECGITEIIATLLCKLPDPCPRTREGLTPPHLAVLQERKDTIFILVAAGADRSCSGLLQMLVKDHTLLFPRQVIKQRFKGDVRLIDTYRMYELPEEHSPITLALAIGSKPIFNQLKDVADIEQMGRALDQACIHGFNDITEQILYDCPTIDRSHPALANALTTSALSSNDSLQAILRARPELDDRDGFLSKILHAAIRHHPDIVMVLIERGASVNACSDTHPRETPLKAAIKMQKETLAINLIEMGAIVSDPDHLSLAVLNGLKHVVELLLNCGLDINEVGKYGKGPLQAAAAANNPEMVELLLSRGADIELGWRDGTTPLSETGAWGNIEAATVLIQKEADINVDSSLGTPMIRAADGDYIKYIKLLLKHGANVNTVSGEESKSTALSIAAEKGNLELCKLLLSYGADPNSPASTQSPLMVVYDAEINSEIVELLLDHGANPNLDAGCSALERAVYNGNRANVRLLVQHGAALDFRGGKQGSIMHAAAKSWDKEIVQLMLQYGAKIFEEEDAFGGLLPLAHPINYKILLEHGAK